MNDSDTLALLTSVLCLAASMFFSCSETAITSVGERQARRILDEGGSEAKIIEVWVKHPVRVLSTILVGNNIANTLMGAVATAVAIRHLSGGEWGGYAVAIAVVVTTGLLLVFGEIMPKAVGRIYSHRIALPALAVLNVLGTVLFPITWVLTKMTNLFIARAVERDGQQLFRRVTPDEIDYLVAVGQKEGSIPAEQAALLRGVFRFEDKIVRDIMVPRDRVTAIELDWPAKRVFEVAHRSGHSRMPVCDGGLGNIKGILHIKQLVGSAAIDRAGISRVMRAPFFVSESLLVQDLLRRFKEQRAHLAVVVDDGGHTVGVVTLEDVLEQLVGQIFDESDVPPTAPNPADDTNGVSYLDAQESLTRIEELFGVEFEEFEGVSSIGDLLTQLGGQIPVPGSVFVCAGLRFKVLSGDARHVKHVSVELLELEAPEE